MQQLGIDAQPAACAAPCCAADKDHFAELAVTAIMRLKGTGNLESIHIIKKPGGALKVSVCAVFVLHAVRMLPQQWLCCTVLHAWLHHRPHSLAAYVSAA